MSDYLKQLKNLSFDCVDPAKIYASTNKYYLIIEKQCEDNDDGGNTFEVEASLPAVNVTGISDDTSPLNIPYQGTSIFTAGSTTQYTPISVTLFDRDDYLFRKYLMWWQSNIHNYSLNSTKMTNSNVRRVILAIYDHDNTFKKSYVFNHAFPSSVDAVSLNWQSANNLATYGVTFHFSYAETINVETELPLLEKIENYSDPSVIAVIPEK